ncbi:MAG: hypothetical protein OXM58_09425 [Rhodospirillaceae bacterium]|nr:hypothetical protein [Rhodospirillaceae bacterium]MDE0616919.1 hypothetical protein [Rhodospirillaceae bacterium]
MRAAPPGHGRAVPDFFIFMERSVQIREAGQPPVSLPYLPESNIERPHKNAGRRSGSVSVRLVAPNRALFFAVISTGAPDLSGAERRNLFPAEQGPKYQTEKISPLRGCAAPVEMTGSK